MQIDAVRLVGSAAIVGALYILKLPAGGHGLVNGIGAGIEIAAVVWQSAVCQAEEIVDLGASQREVERLCAAGRVRHLVNDDLALLYIGESADDGLARLQVDAVRRIPIVTGGARQRPPLHRRLCHMIGAGPQVAGVILLAVFQCELQGDLAVYGETERLATADRIGLLFDDDLARRYRVHLGRVRGYDGERHHLWDYD